MTALVSGADVSTAWLAGVTYLLAQPNGEASNLGVAIGDPTAERTDLRGELDAFAQEMSRAGHEVPRIDSVAGTIFPTSFYRSRAADPETHLYALERRIRVAVRKHPQNRGGTYFERLVSYPVGDGKTMNQLHHVTERLRSAARNGRRNGNQYELSLFHPDARLIEVNSKQPGLRWPIPIDARLDGLVGAANSAGAATTRQELVAALLLSAPTVPQKLRDVVLSFRIATVRHAALANKVGEYPVRRPGRPSGSRRI